MSRGLKMTMVLLGGVLCIEGTLDIALPAQRAAGMGLDKCASNAQLPMAILGATWIAAGAWTAAGARDPLRHLNWVKFALTLPLMLLVALVVEVLRGDVTFQGVAVDAAFNALFVTLFIIFYPRGTTRSSKHEV